MNAMATRFADQRYVLLPSVLTPSSAALLYAHALEVSRHARGDEQVPDAPAVYADPRMEELLLSLLPRVEEASALRLDPTYSYLRVYARGDDLAPHRDRPSCEISLSLNLGYEGASSWPLWMEGPAGVTPVRMGPGDAVLYRGTECLHWRDPFPGERAAQAFLHYVDRDGVNAQWKFDRRSGLSLPAPCDAPGSSRSVSARRSPRPGAAR